MALVLRNEKATSVIFEKIGTYIKYISAMAKKILKIRLKTPTTEQFLEVLDKTITPGRKWPSRKYRNPQNHFRIKENWIEDNKIKKEYLEKLKKSQRRIKP